MHKLYTDGGARGNPGPAAAGVFLFNDEELVAFDGKYLGETTNNTAEYEALILGLTICVKNSINQVTCHLDSELVVKQIKGEYKIKLDHLSELHQKVTDLAKTFDSIKFIHIPREQNKHADRMVNLVLDTRA